MKNSKRFLSFALSLLLILSISPTNIYAQTDVDTFKFSNNEIIQMDTLLFSNTSDSNYEKLFDERTDKSEKDKSSSSISSQYPYLINPKLKVDGDMVTINTELQIDKNRTVNISSIGNLFGAKRSRNSSSTILARFEETKEVKIVQFRIDSVSLEYNVPVASLTIQLQDTEELFYFQFELSENIIDKLSSIADFSDEKVFAELYDIGKNLINPIESSISVSVEGNGNGNVAVMEIRNKSTNELISKETLDATSFSAAENEIRTTNETIPYSRQEGDLEPDRAVNSPKAARYSAWVSFFNRLESHGWASLNSYSIDTYAITGLGWNHLQDNGSGPYFVTSYVRNNGSREKLVDIMLVEVVHHKSNSNYQSFQLRVENVMKLSYDSYYNEVDVIYYNWGPYLYNVGMALTLPGGSNTTTVFKNQYINGRLNGSPRRVDFLAAFIPHASTYWPIWTNLEVTDTQPFGGMVLYEETFTKQVNKYRAVIRSIAADSGIYRMSEKGQNIYLDGDLYNGFSNSTTYYWQYDVGY